MLVEVTSHFFVYVTLYSIAIVVGLLFTFLPNPPKGSALVGLGLLILGLGFPPSPLFVVKLTLGATCASSFGAVFTSLLGALLLVAWFRFFNLVIATSAPKTQRTQAQSRHHHASRLIPSLPALGLALLVCTPLGLGLVCGL